MNTMKVQRQHGRQMWKMSVWSFRLRSDPTAARWQKKKKHFTVCFLDPTTSSSDQTWLEWLTQLNVTQVPTSRAFSPQRSAVWTQPYGSRRKKKKKKKRYYSVPAGAGFVGPCSFPWGLQQQAVLRVVGVFDDSQRPPEATLVAQFFKGGQLTPDDVCWAVRTVWTVQTTLPSNLQPFAGAAAVPGDEAGCQHAQHCDWNEYDCII